MHEDHERTLTGRVVHDPDAVRVDRPFGGDHRLAAPVGNRHRGRADARLAGQPHQAEVRELLAVDRDLLVDAVGVGRNEVGPAAQRIGRGVVLDLGRLPEGAVVPAEVPPDRTLLQQREAGVVHDVAHQRLTAQAELVEDHPLAGDRGAVPALQVDLQLEKAVVDVRDPLHPRQRPRREQSHVIRRNPLDLPHAREVAGIERLHHVGAAGRPVLGGARLRGRNDRADDQPRRKRCSLHQLLVLLVRSSLSMVYFVKMKNISSQLCSPQYTSRSGLGL